MLTLYTTAKTEARFFITNHIIAEIKKTRVRPTTTTIRSRSFSIPSRCPKILKNAIEVVVAVYLPTLRVGGRHVVVVALSSAVGVPCLHAPLRLRSAPLRSAPRSKGHLAITTSGTCTYYLPTTPVLWKILLSKASRHTDRSLIKGRTGFCAGADCV